MERGLLTAVGIGLALFGALFFAMFLSEFVTGGDGKTETGVYIGLIVFFGGMLAGGLFLIWRMVKGGSASAGSARPGSGGTASGPAPTGQSPTGHQPGMPNGQDEPTSPPASPAERERRVLLLAERRRGRVTVPEVAAHCDLTVAEAKAELDRLVEARVADLQVTPAGVLVYAFPGFLSDEDKSRATDF